MAQAAKLGWVLRLPLGAGAGAAPAVAAAEAGGAALLEAGHKTLVQRSPYWLGWSLLLGLHHLPPAGQP